MTRDSPFPYPPCAEAILAFAALTFLVGSYCYLPGTSEEETDDKARVGDILFIVGSFIYVGRSLTSVKELLRNYKWTILEARHHAAEFFENVCYVLSALIFSFGCVLFWPGIYAFMGMTHWRLTGEIAASWLFVVGSLGFVTASFCNAVMLSKDSMFKVFPGGYGKRAYNAAFVALLCSQSGGVFFVAGSFLYRPGLRTHCNLDIEGAWLKVIDDNPTIANMATLREGIKSRLNVTDATVDLLLPHIEGPCLNAMTAGTRLYIIGSYFYFIQSLLYLWMGFLRKRGAIKDLLAGIERSDDEESSSIGSKDSEEELE